MESRPPHVGGGAQKWQKLEVVNGPVACEGLGCALGWQNPRKVVHLGPDAGMGVVHNLRFLPKIARVSARRAYKKAEPTNS